jgi:DNA invertase Pin-like site-specific DNA recombinase
MTRIAFYARYFCDKQSETSIDDQIRRCHQIAARHGLPTDDALVFADGALSATGEDGRRRPEYQRLIAAWEANEFRVLLVDEWSRLTREPLEHATIVRRLEQSRRVRLISDDGVDTNMPNWQLTVGLLGMFGRQSMG